MRQSVKELDTGDTHLREESVNRSSAGTVALIMLRHEAWGRPILSSILHQYS